VHRWAINKQQQRSSLNQQSCCSFEARSRLICMQASNAACTLHL
jgi:hypothetical protein